jgi:hypothetical protein
MTRSRVCLASPSRNIATYLCHYSFPLIHETCHSFFLSLLFAPPPQLLFHRHYIRSTTCSFSVLLLLLLRWEHVEFYLHAHMAWCLNMHWMLRILQAENGLWRNHSLSTGNDSCKGLVIALLTVL